MRAWELLQDAYQAQMEGDYDRAVELYKASLELHPTAEAHTFLGWAYHFQGKLGEAIEQCRTAIDIDPEFGNPYHSGEEPPACLAWLFAAGLGLPRTASS